MTEILTPSGVLLERPLVPGSAEWLQRMSASKIAAVVGLSPYQSRYSLWMRMAGLVPQEKQTDQMARGHYLEPGCAAWLADQHPDWVISKTGTFAHPTEPWMVGSPDRLGTLPNGHTVLVQCKTAGDQENYGAALSDDLPVCYRSQAMWEMLVTGLRRCHFAVLLPYLEFREFVVDYVEGEAAYLRSEARTFLDSIAAGVRPDLDGHKATYEVVKQLHPDIDDVKVDVPGELAVAYVESVAACKAAEAAKRKASALLLEEMGSAKSAYHAGVCIARRQANKNGAPSLYAAKNVNVSDLRSEAA